MPGQRCSVEIICMIVVDAHQDIAYNAVCYRRDYLTSALVKRRLEGGRPWGATTGLPDALIGRVAVVFSTLFVAPASAATPWEQVSYHTPAEAYRRAMDQIDYYHRLADTSPRLRLIRETADLDAVLETWGPDKNLPDRQQGLVILMENADPILEPKQFEEWYERGVRIVGPAWQASRYCGGTGAPGPLTTLGFQLLEVMAGLNAILDLSHMAEWSFLQALEAYEGAVIASHSNPRRFCNTDRHLSDEMIRLLAERDGVMGVVPYNRFLSNDWRSGDPRSDVPFNRVIEVIDYICQLTGSAAHVGIGSDFDGGFGREAIPDGMETVTDLWNIGQALLERGYSEEDTAAVLGGNMLRKLRESLGG